ncbi:MAG: flagellar basal body rod protein FlgB [Clostridiales bacterium]|nr:flagellar basal body rod protein FlgB [Clostridiales bacterium]
MMFYDSSRFKVLEAGVKLSWMQQQLNSQNITNIETPGYKSKSLSFESVLREAENSKEAPDIERIDAEIKTSDEVSTRPDGNNVDVEVEYLALYKAYVQYSMLLDKVNGEFEKYNYVLNSNM